MLGLGAAQFVTGHHRAGQAQATGEFTGQIGQDVAVKVFRHQHVKALRVAHQPGGAGIDQQVVEFDFGKVLRHAVRALQEQSIGHVKTVGLVDGSDFLAPRHGQFKGAPGNAQATVARDLAHADGHVGAAVVHAVVVTEETISPAFFWTYPGRMRDAVPPALR